MAVKAEIIRTRGGTSDITILPNVNTLQCILNVVGAKLKVLTYLTPLASVLGFNRSTYGVGRHASDQPVNIMSVNSILVHCNIIHCSYIYPWCTSSSCLQFLPKCRSWTEDTRSTKQFNLPPGSAIISTLSVWLTDQHGKALDLR